ncbi:MAG: hypothetical protein JXX28_12380 [Deltaproteobacteria bacterium]|nr:hypothetical protein [Deltaproteobacteria bacterium]
MSTLASTGAALTLPLITHLAVLPDPADGLEGQREASTLSVMLRATGRYSPLAPALLEERLGAPPSLLFQRCWDDAACWRAAGARAELEQLVLVERIDAQHLGLRVVDVQGDGPLRKAVVPSGQLAAVALSDLLFAPGALTVRLAPSAREVRVDGETMDLRGGVLSLAQVEPGKHTVETLGPAPSAFTEVMVYPGAHAVVDLSAQTLPAHPARGGAWWAASLVGAGLIGATIAAQGQAPAVHAPR